MSPITVHELTIFFVNERIIASMHSGFLTEMKARAPNHNQSSSSYAVLQNPR